jgi:integrase
MTRTTERLTWLQIKALDEPGRYSDGGNLYVVVHPGGTKTWAFLYRWRGERTKAGHGKQIEAGGGSINDVSLKKARAWAAEGRAMLSERPSRNPVKVWQDGRKSLTPTFSKMADEFFTSKSRGWRSSIHRAQVKRMLQRDCKPLADKPVDAITTDNVVQTVEAKLKTAPVSALRLRGYIEQVLARAQALGHIDQDRRNVALWRTHLDQVLPKRPPKTHFRALPYAELPAFMTELRALRQESGLTHYVAAFALELCILTATRANETLRAQWSEIDLAQRIWTLLSHRMKSGRPHQVPLSDGAVAVLDAMQRIRVGEFVFPGIKIHQPIGPKRFGRVLRLLIERNGTTHGFRSSFRDWAGNETAFPREVCEEALAHAVGDETERSYRRSLALEKHRALLQAWDDYLR